MKFKWYDTASWRFITSKGTRIITDPFFSKYVPDGPPPAFMDNRTGVDDEADLVTITHPHFDHSSVTDVKGVFQLYTCGGPFQFRDVKLHSIRTWHDNYGDYGRIINSVIIYEADDMRIIHMGDYGQDYLYDEQLEQIEQIGKIDILFTPWGTWTKALVDQLKPKLIFPMHHAHPDDYMRSLNYTQLNVSEVEYTPATLPRQMKCFMLKGCRAGANT
jgi:L-ascorbate metabolism protein UlaG (beta-lactamase superfamily)